MDSYGQVITSRNPSPLPRMRRMPIARKHLYEPTHGPWIHAISRCVRRGLPKRTGTSVGLVAGRTSAASSKQAAMDRS